MKPSPKSTKDAREIPAAPAAGRTRIVIVDGQGSARGFFREALARREDYEVVGEGRTGTDALRLCRQLKPAVLITELMLRDMGAATIIAELRAENSPTCTLIFTACRNEAALIDALRMRPHGLVHKDDSFPVIWDALKLVARGGCAISRSLAELNGRALAGQSAIELTTRERAVLQMIAEGRSSKEIAPSLGVTERAIEHNRDDLNKKLGTRDIATLTRIAVRMGLVQ